MSRRRSLGRWSRVDLHPRLRAFDVDSLLPGRWDHRGAGVHSGYVGRPRYSYPRNDLEVNQGKEPTGR